jgi:homeobox protein cut-like
MASNAPGAPLSEHQQKPLEILLLEKNRFLQNENTQVKNRLSELQIKYDKTTTENKELVASNLEQKKLIIELEKDLMKLAENKTENIVSASDPVSLHSSQNLNVSGENASIINDLDTTSELITKSSSNNNNNNNTADMSLFNIVSNQRERFRARVQELESENISSKQQIIFLTNEIDRLRSDNVKLYEKIKFLQSFAASNSSKSNDFETIDLEESIGSGSGSNVLNKYTSEYEKRLDPFSKFNYREKQKRYSNLKLHDKFTLQFGKFILSNKLARLIFVGYFVVIHLLIFLSLYNVAHNKASIRDLSAECANSYRDHMAHVHGVTQFDPLHTLDHKH